MDAIAGSADGLLDWAVASRPIAGQAVSGDLHLVAAFPGGVLVAVIDGLGHGPEARLAARAAVDALSEAPEQPVGELIARCHQALARLRGAVMSLASFDVARSTMTWIGVGNVEGVLLHSASPSASAYRAGRERLLVWGGVVGQAMKTLRPASLPVSAGDTLILATDGVRSAFVDALPVDDSVEALAARVLTEHHGGNDDALVLAARCRWSAS